MLRILTATSLLALASTPLLAQNEMSTQGQPVDHSQHRNDNAATPATPATPAMPAQPGNETDTDSATTQATPATPATPAQPAMDSSTPTAPTPPTESRAVTVQRVVDAEFPTYDANKSGNLESAEFSKWMLALYDASASADAPKEPAARDKWAQAAFTTADTDKNNIITKEEMKTFLVG